MSYQKNYFPSASRGRVPVQRGPVPDPKPPRWRVIEDQAAIEALHGHVCISERLGQMAQALREAHP